MVRSEPNESKAINQAALEWARLNIAVLLGLAAIGLGLAVAGTIAGNERWIPLYIVGAIPIVMAGRIARRYAEFSRLVAAGLRANNSR